MSGLTPAEAAALVAVDRAVLDAASDMAVAALVFCARPEVFPRFRRSLLDVEQDTAWVAQLEAGTVATFAEVLAPGGGQ